MKLETRYAASPREMERLNTTELREQYLVESIFIPGDILLTYTHNDRMIFGGVTPTTTPLEIVLSTELGVEYFLERRELGVINIGGSGSITIEGETFAMEKQDGFYIGKETKDIQFMSNDASHPAKFYVVSVPAHKKYPNVKISIDQITPRLAGEAKSMNDREIFQYIHPNVCESCQLQMGYTILKEGSSWNTMPSHTHERRMETYLYFDIPEGNRVFHFMGQPQETRHLLVSNEQACISPSWSIHTGVATSNYSFIWSMCGENITYDDMDHVAMEDLR
ncbi:5-dehydro-4-deoxy-D-glucuronate isomerase [Erysipelothrix aquatica]|uniref:5-dehydro-4-deoxy-D-glucuronate isomerase n=1 Tax=Erysipelothrix aquatica TaxID=2683714 RepID=UPI00135912AB|nr:5-dehydro-4-deoxy-D-glucuronate isomerase [Erysipelothrix aquatica]